MTMKLKSSAGTKFVPETSDMWAIAGKQLTEANLNEVSTPGLYWMNASANVTHRPVERTGGLFVIKINSTSFAQLFIGSEDDHSTAAIYMRIITPANSIYKDWRKVTMTSL